MKNRENTQSDHRKLFCGARLQKSIFKLLRYIVKINENADIELGKIESHEEANRNSLNYRCRNKGIDLNPEIKTINLRIRYISQRLFASQREGHCHFHHQNEFRPIVLNLQRPQQLHLTFHIQELHPCLDYLNRGR